MLLSLHEFRCPLGQKKGGPQEMQVYPDICMKIIQLIIDILAYPDMFMKRHDMYVQSGYVIEKQSDNLNMACPVTLRAPIAAYRGEGSLRFERSRAPANYRGSSPKVRAPSKIVGHACAGVGVRGVSSTLYPKWRRARARVRARLARALGSRFTPCST